MPRDGVPMGVPVKGALDWLFNVGAVQQQGIVAKALDPNAAAQPAVAKAKARDTSFLKKAPWTWEEGTKAAPYMENSDLLLDEELTASMKVRLVKRKVEVTRKQFSKIWQPEFLEANEFSARCSNPKGSPGNATGKGPYNLAVYYEPSKKSTVERAFESVGCTIGKTPQENVNMDAEDEIEMYLQYRHSIGLFGRFLVVQNTELEVMRQDGGLIKI